MKRLRFNEDARARLKEAITHAKKHELKESLSRSLTQLRNIAKNFNGHVQFYTDFAPLSFTWAVLDSKDTRVLDGGMIYHGPHDGFGDGSAPTFSVSLDPSHGWQLHT
jgi:hypothetical protein